MTALRRTLLATLTLALLHGPVIRLMPLLLPDATVAPELNLAADAALSLAFFALPGWLLRPARKQEETKSGLKTGWVLLAIELAVLARSVVKPLNAWWADLVQAERHVMIMPESAAGVALGILAAALVPAVAEELFFRGTLLENLQRSCSRGRTLLLTTAMFTLMHGSLAGLPGHLLMGLLLSLLAMHTGRLAEPVAAHMLFNLLALLRWDAGPVLPWICAALLGVLVIWMLCGLRRDTNGRLPLAESLLCAGILLVLGAQYLW